MSDAAAADSAPKVDPADARKWVTNVLGFDFSIADKKKELAAQLAKDRGGSSQKDFEERRATTILEGMERASNEQQATANRLSGTNAPLAHPVTAHGPGTDQVGRLVHGRRGDEAGGTKPADVTLTGNAET